MVICYISAAQVRIRVTTHVFNPLLCVSSKLPTLLKCSQIFLQPFSIARNEAVRATRNKREPSFFLGRGGGVRGQRKKYLNYDTAECKRTCVTQYCTQYPRLPPGRVPSSPYIVCLLQKSFFCQRVYPLMKSSPILWRQSALFLPPATEATEKG